MGTAKAEPDPRLLEGMRARDRARRLALTVILAGCAASDPEASAGAGSPVDVPTSSGQGGDAPLGTAGGPTSTTGPDSGSASTDVGQGADADILDAASGTALLPPPLERVQIVTDATGAHVEQQSGPTVRFIALGDTGTGEADQKQVAAAMKQKCDQDGCDFVVLLGDNIYEGGPISLDDPQWQTKFEEPYADLDLPFYVVLGNHDVGLLPGAGYNPGAVPLEVGYTERSEIWKMPAAHYTVSVGDVGFVMFDTTALYNHVVEQGDQHAWIDAARDALLEKHRWVFAAAHHTFISNGEHGNAGAYAYFDLDPGLEIEAFVTDELCGQVDGLLTGHDHNREWFDGAACAGTEVIVSGAGAKTRPIVGTNPVLFESDALGFLYVVVEGDTLTGQFLDDQGSVSFERTLQK